MQDIFQIKPEDARRLMDFMFGDVRSELRKLLPDANIRDGATLTFDNSTGEVIQSYPPFPEQEAQLNNLLWHLKRGHRRAQVKKYGWGTINGEPFQDGDFNCAWCIAVNLDKGGHYSFFISDLVFDHVDLWIAPGPKNPPAS